MLKIQPDKLLKVLIRNNMKQDCYQCDPGIWDLYPGRTVPVCDKHYNGFNKQITIPRSWLERLVEYAELAENPKNSASDGRSERAMLYGYLSSAKTILEMNK